MILRKKNILLFKQLKGLRLKREETNNRIFTDDEMAFIDIRHDFLTKLDIYDRFGW